MSSTRFSTIGVALAGLMLAGCGAANPAFTSADYDNCVGERDHARSELQQSRIDTNDAVTRLNRVEDILQAADRRLVSFQKIAVMLRAAFITRADRIKYVIRDGHLVVQLPDEILFKEGSSKLSESGIDVVKKLATVLGAIHDRNFLIAGNTDDVPVSKYSTEYSSNWQLSTQRALAVLTRLVDEGVDPTQLGAAGFGQYQPDASNETAEGRAQNRRTEIIILPTVDEIPKLQGSI